MIGFPLPYFCEGWHTSGSEQFFILEFLFDFFLYFMFWLLIIYLINGFIVKIQFSKIFRVTLLVIAFLLLLTNGIFTFMPENVFSIKREFGIEIKESQYKFIWQNILRPELR
uniref:hypothetical protein n=1 Tax=Mariniflexile sp. TaxID=1979402 RepID=UPI004047D62E